MKKFTFQEIKEFVSKPIFDEKVILNKDSSWPKISIVTPVFNARPFIEAAIRSVIEQDYPDIEYIVIDGGSTDGTKEIIQKYSKHLAYWESTLDRGQTHALNKGFARATGVLRGWLNADEEYLPGALRYVGEVYMTSKDLDLIYGDRYLEDLMISPSRRFLEKIPRSIKPFAYMFYTGRTLFSDATFWTKEIHNILGELDERYQRYAMDVEWLLRVTGVAQKWKHIGQPLSVFKRHGLNVSTEGVKKGIRLNETIRRHYAINHNIPITRLALGWLWYSTKLRIWEKGVFGIFIPPRWETFARLFLHNHGTRMHK